MCHNIGEEEIWLVDVGWFSIMVLFWNVGFKSSGSALVCSSS